MTQFKLPEYLKEKMDSSYKQISEFNYDTDKVAELMYTKAVIDLWPLVEALRFYEKGSHLYAEGKQYTEKIKDPIGHTAHIALKKVLG